MPPKSKFDPSDPAVAALITQFQSIGLTEAKATDVARNSKNAATLSELIEKNQLATKAIDSKRGALLTTLAVSVSGGQLGQSERDYATGAIVDGRLKTTEQVAGAISHLGPSEQVSFVCHSFSRCKVPFCASWSYQRHGVRYSVWSWCVSFVVESPSPFLTILWSGFSITPERLKEKVAEHITTSGVSGWQDLGATLGALRSNPALCWANPLEVKTTVEILFAERFGAKEAAPKAAKAPPKPPKVGA
jgi:glutaminyl-tRNA synthetase